MKLYVINALTSGPKILEFHYCMFHGKAVTEESNRFLHGDTTLPLRLACNGWNLPDVFEPSGGLVISQKVRDALDGTPNVRFLPVVFDKLVRYPFRAGDNSYYDTPEFRRNPSRADPAYLIDRLPDEPRLRSTLPAYYEVVMARYSDICGGFARLKPVVCEPSFLFGPIEVGLSPALVEAHPAFWYYNAFFEESVFNILRPFIDWDYFEVITVEF